MNWMTWIPLLDDLYNTQVSKHLPCQEALLVDVLTPQQQQKKTVQNMQMENGNTFQKF